MGTFSKWTGGAFRYTRDGRRLYARRYLVSDADLERVEARIQAEGYIALALAMVISAIAWHIWGELWGWLGFGLGQLLRLPYRRWITSRLPIVTVPDSELAPSDREALTRAYAQAKGRPTMWGIFLVFVGMAALGGYAAFTGEAWYGWFLFIVSSWCALLFLRQGHLFDKRYYEE
jgi:hypothetical protein